MHLAAAGRVDPHPPAASFAWIVLLDKLDRHPGLAVRFADADLLNRPRAVDRFTLNNLHQFKESMQTPNMKTAPSSWRLPQGAGNLFPQFIDKTGPSIKIAVSGCYGVVG